MTKKAAQATPNQLLRRARLERGWTQKEVADRIGAPLDLNVTRWERGIAWPSAYYVQKLCELFSKSASELGLLPPQLEATVSSQPGPTRSENELPTGTITLLFADMEGSTRLLQQVGERYASLLEECRFLMRAAFLMYHGHEVDTQGDAFFVAFARATDAVSAAVAVQRAIFTHAWPHDVTIRVRIGLHTGEPQLVSEGYVGLDVHRAARIMSAGHGGQVLLSLTTCPLIEQDLPDDVHLRDLGEHRLKDLGCPMHLFQLVISGLLADFPPLKTLDSFPNNLPAQPTPFLGREAELAQIEDYLDNPDCRLLTLIGPGGVGKTRLAYKAATGKARDFASGVCAIPLAGLASPDYVLPTIAEHLTLPWDGSLDQKTQVLDSLCEKHLLLVVDKCEHVLDGMGLLAEILASAPSIKILATSRERLNLQGEWLIPVQGLAFPQNENEPGFEGSSAVQLFTQSAQRSEPGFHLDDRAAVTRICQLVEGLPLALELAASWVHQMPCARIAAYIERDLDFLASNLRDVPERHRSAGALFEHSWRLLSSEEQAVLRKLSVFRGGFDADAAASIAGSSLRMLSRLAEKSLVRANFSGRYDLHELLRQFVEEKVREADEFETTRDKHLDYFVTWAERANEGLHSGEQVQWFGHLETEHNNARAALRWGINGQLPETGLRLAVALWYFWFRRGYWREGFEWLKVGIERTEGDTSTRAEAMFGAATLLAQLDSVMTGSYLNEGLRIGEKLGLPDVVAMMYVSLSLMEDYEKATALFEQAISLLRQVDDRFRLTVALYLYGDRTRAQGDLSRAEVLYQECLDIAQADQNLELMVLPLGNLGRLAMYRDDYGRAAVLLQQAIAVARTSKNRIALAEWLIHLGTLEMYRGAYDAAREDLEEALALFRDFGNRMGIAHAYQCLSDLALHQGNDEQAARLVSESLSMSQRFLGNFSNREFTVMRLLIVSKLARVRQDDEKAAQLLGAAESLREQNHYLFEPLPREEYEEAIAQVRAHLDPAVFATAWADGQAKTEAEVVTAALEYVQAQFDVVR
jgi:predicted ATPase/class 3 adenylate cyclase